MHNPLTSTGNFRAGKKKKKYKKQHHLKDSQLWTRQPEQIRVPRQTFFFQTVCSTPMYAHAKNVFSTHAANVTNSQVPCEEQLSYFAGSLLQADPVNFTMYLNQENQKLAVRLKDTTRGGNSELPVQENC